MTRMTFSGSRNLNISKKGNSIDSIDAVHKIKNMSDFFRSSPSPSNKPDMVAQKEAVVNAIRAEINLATAQELISKTSEKCFAKCVPKPGVTLTSSDETCLTRCMDRYLEAFNIVSRTLTNRANQHGRESAL